MAPSRDRLCCATTQGNVTVLADVGHVVFPLTAYAELKRRILQDKPLFPNSLHAHWPILPNMNTSCDPSPYFSLILPNTTASRVCGLTTTNNTALESCCEGGGPVSEYQCKKYCSTNLEINEFVDCLSKDHNASALIELGPFCQDGIKSNNTNSLSGDQRSAASGRLVKTKSILWLLLLSFTAFVNSETIPSLSTTKNLTPRQEQSSSSCSIDLHANYTTIRNSRKMSADMECSDDTYCTQNFAVETDILQNNRTINGTSAAEPQYDEFFEMLQTRTDRQFPALSSVKLSYDFLVGPGSFWVDFTPHAVRWCFPFCGAAY